MAETNPSVGSRSPSVENRGPSPKGCLVVLAAAWGVWVFIDLWRLSVFTGATRLGDAVFEMPSIGMPLLLAIGVSAVAFGVWRRNRRKKEFPGEPWMWEKRWRRSGARPLEVEKLVEPGTFALMATFGCAVVAVLSLVLFDDPFMKWAVAPFYLVGLYSWAYLAYRAARVLRFRRVFFIYDAFPFLLGREVAGALVGLESITGFDEMTLTLRCVEESWAGASRRTKTRRTVMEEARRLRPEEIVGRPVNPGDGVASAPGDVLRLALPVAFAVPADAKGTRLSGNPAYRWELHAAARRPGMDFGATFLLPVYREPHGQAKGASAAV